MRSETIAPPDPDVLRQMFGAWDPCSEEETEDLFRVLAELVKCARFALLETENNDLFFTVRTEAFAQGTPLSFRPSDWFVHKWRDPSCAYSTILPDSSDEYCKRERPLGEFDPYEPNVEVLVFPFTVSERLFVLLATGSREEWPAHEARFKHRDIENFEALCNLVTPCLILGSSLQRKDIDLWRDCHRLCNAGEPTVLVSFLNGLLKERLRQVSASFQDVDVIVDALTFLAKHRIPRTEAGKDEEDYYVRLFGAFSSYLGRIGHKNSLGSVTEEPPLTPQKIIISFPFLLAYFLNVFACEIGPDGRVLASLSTKERLDLYERLARAIKFCFIVRRDKRDNERKELGSDSVFYFSDAPKDNYVGEKTDFPAVISYVVSEYAALVADLPRNLQLEHHLHQMAVTQALFYATKNHYRDHFIHVLDVCFFGLFLINQAFPGMTLPVEISVRNWLMASLFHDVGHVLEIYDLVKYEAKHLDCEEVTSFRKNIHETINDSIRLLNEKVKRQFDELEVFLPDSAYCGLNHGVVSAAHLAHLLARIHAGSGAETDPIIAHKDALCAVAMHDCADAPVSLSETGLAAVLKICDEIQDWERPRIEVLPFREQILAAVKYGISFAPDGASMLRTIELEAGGNRFTGPLRLPQTTRGIPKVSITLDYRDVQDNEFFIIYSWIQKSHKLQDLHLEQFMDLEITFISTARAPEGDMNRFKMARREQRIWDFEDWIKLVRPYHSYSVDDKVERLTVSIQALHNKRPLRVPPTESLARLVRAWVD